MRIGLGLALGVMMAGNAAAEMTHKGREMPPYRVERAEGAREIRAYGPHLLAEVRVSGGRQEAVRTGFSVLAGYIFGANATGEKIAMTVPVGQSGEAEAAGGAAAGRIWTVSFMMPARLSATTLPAPDNGAIRFVEAGPSRQVVERFAGLPETADLAARAEALRLWALAGGFEILAGPHYYFYDAPMTLPQNRRNEVAFTIR
jgi:hypothetical protein